MLALLVLVSGLHYARSDDIPKDTNYVIRHNVSCSASGVFFERQEGAKAMGPGTCFLCFCQNNHTAVCWRRENSGCDLGHYRNLGTRNLRARRSPLSLGEVFLRDAARDFFNKQSPEQCKPFESSFSDGCPPADWCIGCTVCDCDANGHWDCHVLSFCPDKNGKKQMKKRRGHPRSRISKRQSKTSTTNVLRSTKKTTKPPKKPTRKRFVNANIKKNRVKQSSAINKHEVNPVKATKINKFAPVKKPLQKIQAKKSIPSRNKVTSKPLYIKKHLSTSKPGGVKSRSDVSKNYTVEVAQKVVKQFMSTVQKMIKNFTLKPNKTSKQENKVLRKRSMPKQGNKKNIKEVKQKFKPVTKSKLNVTRKDSGKRITQKSHNANTSNYGRIKRQVTLVDTTSHKSDSYYSYTLNAIDKIDQSLKNNNTQDLLLNNPINSVLSLQHSSSNELVTLAQPKNTTNQEIYVTDIHVGDLHTFVQDKPFYNSVNKTEGEDKIVLNTNSSYLLSNITQFHHNNNKNYFKQNFQKKDKDLENLVFKKEYSYLSNQTENHSCKFRTLLQKLIGTDTDQYNNTITNFETTKKPKRYTILSKIRRLFKKIFNKRNKNKFYHKDDLYLSNYNIQQSDDKKSGHCKLDTKEKDKLRQSIYELKRESKSILKTIRIIKGLLHILEINTNKTQYNVSNYSYESNDNINKLNTIVKNPYYNQENSKKLTQDQQTQINYIKNNVQVFIKSIGKFATILDGVIQTASCHNKKAHEILNLQLNKKNDVINYINKHYSNTTQMKLEKLKKLILNYNVLQNKFINHIYLILNNLEANITNKDNFKAKVSNEHYKLVNATDAIEINSANIIKNIRKLKHLAERINVQRRNKRETIDDDALEYLLVLMEYLLKKQVSVYPTANDGLDLLIEAIKSAPDIKLTRKKVLDNVTEKPVVITRSTTSIHSFKNYKNSTEDQKNYSSEINRNKIKVTKQLEDDVDVNDDKIEEIYRSFKYNNHFSSEQKQDDVVLGRSSDISKSYYNKQKEATTRTSRSRDNGVLGYKATHDSLDEEITIAPLTIGVELDTTSVSSVTDYSTENVKNEIKSNSNIDNFLVDPKANIDWIEENFKEIKQLREVQTGSSTPKSLTATRTHKHTENISDDTSENEAYNQKKVVKTSAEEIMSKKQLDLLNSLDYVEDEEESKDDRFSSDTYL